MGWQPKSTRRAPTAEEFHLGMARSAYVRGHMEVEEYEACVEHVLAGGYLNQLGKLGGRPAYRPFETETVLA